MTVRHRRPGVEGLDVGSSPGEREQGSTLPLILVFFLVAAGLVIVAAAATALHLDRLRLLTIADGAALAGAESFQLDDVQVRDDTVTPVLRQAAVRRAVQAYLAQSPTTGLDGLHLVTATTADGRTATVQLAATWHPPIAGDLIPISLPVVVQSDARAEFR